MKAKANRAKGATTARRTVAPATAAQARDELRAREIAQRLFDLVDHCAEAAYYFPDEPLFSFDKMFELEVARLERDGTPTRIIGLACFEVLDRIDAAEKERSEIDRTLERIVDEIARGDFIIRYDKENELHYCATLKTPIPKSDWWRVRIFRKEVESLLRYVLGVYVGREEKTIARIFDEAERRVQQTHGDAAAVAIKAARDIFLAYTDAASPDAVKAMQRERAANWIKTEDADGNAPSIPLAVKQFIGEIEAERIKGGYANMDALRTALYKRAEKLGLAKFKKRGK